MAHGSVIDLTLSSDSEPEMRSLKARQGQMFASRDLESPGGSLNFRPDNSLASSVSAKSKSTKPPVRASSNSLSLRSSHPRPKKQGLPFSISALMSSSSPYTSTSTSMRMSTHDNPQQQSERSCLNCSNDPDVTCDGEQPCSSCSEPGFECVYLGENPTPSRASSTIRSSQRGTEQVPKAVHATADHSTYVPKLHLQSLPLTNPAHTAKYRELTIDGSQSHEVTDDDEDIDAAGAVGVQHQFNLDDLEGVKAVLKLHEARMRAHREYLVAPLLKRAKLDCVRNSAQEPGNLSGGSIAALIIGARQKFTNPKSPATSVQMRSHGPGALKKWTTITSPLIVATRDPTIYPKYKSIGRLGTTILATNSYVKKYLPYFADEVPEAERKREEDIARWYQTDQDSMHRQRECLELVQLWKQVVHRFISNLEIQFKDIFWYILTTNDDITCITCDKSLKRERFQAAFSLLKKPDERSLKRARLASVALEDIARIHMWHIITEIDFVKLISTSVDEIHHVSSTLCSICFLHNCITHGAFDEPSDETSGTFAFMGGERGKRRPMMINDDEKDVNQRVSVVVDYADKDAAHQCGLYCVDDTTRIQTLLGQRSDGTVGGVHNKQAYATRPTFDNFETCSPQCFWPVERRIRFATVAQTKSFETSICSGSRELLRQLIGLYSKNQRAPCMIAQGVPELTCMDAFYYVLASTQHPGHFENSRQDLQDQALQKLAKSVQGLDMSMSSQLDERPPFIPCAHEGPCQENEDCSCAKDDVHCEYFCGCDTSCKRRLHGCSCAGKNRVCFNDDRCECWAQNRECDPWLCKTCGAVEVLDPNNKYNEEIRKGRCKNVHMQLDLPARTIKAPSEVQGWGLYAGQDLETHAFIGEYKGEIVGNQESDRRGSIYHHLGQEYLFVTNNEQQIDGSNFGNKTRFINNSQRNDYINVLAKKLLCYGVQRVMLYAKRPIKAGEELLYNYNYPESVTKTFWERGEGPAQVAGAVVAKPSLPTKGRVAKIADDNPAGNRSISRQQPAQPSRNGHTEISHNQAKRKRVSDTEPLVRAAVPGDGVIDNSDASEYETAGLRIVEAVSPNSDHSQDDSSEDAAGALSIRKRRIHPQDGRFGGNAQRKAWETRKNRARIILE